MTTPKVYADFQNLDDFNRLRLTCAGTQEDLARQGVHLAEGLRLTLYMDDADDQGWADELRADGIVHYNEAERCWVAAIDWSAIRHASEETDGDGSGPDGSVPGLPPDSPLTKPRS
jgi:hypothetical protein